MTIKVKETHSISTSSSSISKTSKVLLIRNPKTLIGARRLKRIGMIGEKVKENALGCATECSFNVSLIQNIDMSGRKFFAGRPYWKFVIKWSPPHYSQIIFIYEKLSTMKKSVCRYVDYNLQKRIPSGYMYVFIHEDLQESNDK